MYIHTYVRTCIEAESPFVTPWKKPSVYYSFHFTYVHIYLSCCRGESQTVLCQVQVAQCRAVTNLVCTYVYVYICTYIRTHTCVCVFCMLLCLDCIICLCVFDDVNLCTHVHIPTYMRTYVRMYLLSLFPGNCQMWTRTMPSRRTSSASLWSWWWHDARGSSYPRLYPVLWGPDHPVVSRGLFVWAALHDLMERVTEFSSCLMFTLPY